MATEGDLNPYGGSNKFDSIYPRNGRLSKEDGEWVNEAELLEEIANNTSGGISYKDKTGRVSENSIFGDKIVAQRQSALAMSFCYNLDTRQYVTELNTTGSVSRNDSKLLVSTGTDSAGKAVFETVKSLIYKAAHDAYCNFTFILTPGVANSRQKIGIFNSSDGFSIGFEGEDFAIFRDRNSSNAETVTQQNFNVDKLDGTGSSGFVLDKTKLNLCKINFGYQGGAPIIFQILNEDLEWMPFHIIKFNNKNTTTNISLPYLKFRAEVENFGNTTDISIQSGSIEFGIVNGGVSSANTRKFSFFNTQSYTAGSLQTIAIFHSKQNYSGIINRLEAHLNFLTAANEGNKPLTILMYRLAVAPTGGTWNDVDTNNSFAEYSFDTTPDYTGAELLLPISLGKSGGTGKIDVSQDDFIAYPNDYIAFAFNTTGSGDLDFGFRYSELH